MSRKTTPSKPTKKPTKKSARKATEVLPPPCRVLYAWNADFRAALAQWDHDRRCPIELGDFLDEQDLPGPAACARWAATYPDRDVWLPWHHLAERGGRCGPYPSMRRNSQSVFTGQYIWMFDPNHAEIKFADDVPHDVVDCHRLGMWYRDKFVVAGPTPLDAILTLLDVWKAPQ